MLNQIGFIVKVLLLSTVLSFFIKYGGRLLPLPSTMAVALVFISLPTFIMMVIFWRRSSLTDY